MPGLPKIAVARLKANPDTPRSSGGPEGKAGFEGGHHPDANLLAAFAEKTLTEKERTRVLHHLAQCAECREVAAFALPAEEAATETTRVPAGRSWSPWLVLRWGAMAAVLGILTVVVMRHPDMWNRQPEISQVMHPPAPAGGGTNAPQIVPAPPLPSTSLESAQAKAQGQVQESAGQMAAINRAPEQRRELALSDHAAHAQAGQQIVTRASSQPSTMVTAEKIPNVNAEREGSKEKDVLTAEAKIAPPPTPAPATVTTAPSADATKASGQSAAGLTTMHGVNQNVAVTATGGGGFGGGGGGGGGGVSAPAAKPAAPVTARASVQMTAQAPMAPLRANRTDIESGAPQPSALWSVSSNGKVQHSVDRGKTFEQVHVARSIKFRAIAAFGNDVWAGGAHGALFHSTDGGATWTRTSINVEGNTVTETIDSIQLHGPQHLIITTASGSEWVSEDGGLHWQKQP